MFETAQAKQTTHDQHESGCTGFLLAKQVIACSDAWTVCTTLDCCCLLISICWCPVTVHSLL